VILFGHPPPLARWASERTEKTDVMRFARPKLREELREERRQGEGDEKLSARAPGIASFRNETIDTRYGLWCTTPLWLALFVTEPLSCARCECFASSASAPRRKSHPRGHVEPKRSRVLAIERAQRWRAMETVCAPIEEERDRFPFFKACPAIMARTVVFEQALVSVASGPPGSGGRRPADPKDSERSVGECWWS